MQRRDFVRLTGGAAIGATAIPWPRLAGQRRPPDWHQGHQWHQWHLSEAFRRSLPGRLTEASVPGISIAIGPRTGIAPSQLTVAGVTADGGTAPVTSDTVFAAASLSKPVVATIALELHAAGDFDIDRPLTAYLSTDLPEGPGADRITARICLRHTSGLPNWRYVEEPLRTEFEPGTKWSYSGEGYVLVQRALESTTQQGLEALAQRHVFEPLGMASSSFLARSDLTDRAAVPFVPADNRFEAYSALLAWKQQAVVGWMASENLQPADVTQARLREADAELSREAAALAGRTFPETAPVPNFIVPNGAGSLQTTAPDYLRLLHHWLGNSRLRQLAFERPATRAPGIRWGAGWGLEGDRAFWHWGETLGVRTLAYADLDSDQALVVLTNGDGGMDVAKAAFQDATGGPSPILELI